MKYEEQASLPQYEAGQAMAEYALLAFWTVLVVLASIKALETALLDHYQDVASLILLPIP